MIHPILALLGLTLIAPAQVAEENPLHELPGERFAELRANLQARVSAGSISSLAIVVLEGERVLWAEGMGFQDVDRNTPITTTTIFPIASISKSFTGLAAALLIEEGALSLEDKVDDVLTSFRLQRSPDVTKGPSIRDLATMKVPVDHGTFMTDVDDVDAESADSVRERAIIEGDSGTGFHYSNMTSGILERVVADVSQQTFEGFLRERVFEELGMSSTSAWPRPSEHARTAGPNPPLIYLPTGGVGMYSSAHDLATVAKLHLRPEELGFDSSLSALARHPPLVDGEIPDGYWWGWGRFRHTHLIELTNGQVGDSTSCLALCRERDVAVICLSGTRQGQGFPRLADEIALRGIDVLVPGTVSAYQKAAREADH